MRFSKSPGEPREVLISRSQSDRMKSSAAAVTDKGSSNDSWDIRFAALALVSAQLRAVAAIAATAIQSQTTIPKITILKIRMPHPASKSYSK